MTYAMMKAPPESIVSVTFLGIQSRMSAFISTLVTTGVCFWPYNEIGAWFAQSCNMRLTSCKYRIRGSSMDDSDHAPAALQAWPIFLFVRERSMITGVVTYFGEAASHSLQLEWLTFRHR